MSEVRGVNYALLAAWLGEPYKYVIHDGSLVSSFVAYSKTHEYRAPLSDADLVMAVLEKLAREGREPQLIFVGANWHATLAGPYMRRGDPTPLAAICALIEALEK